MKKKKGKFTLTKQGQQGLIGMLHALYEEFSYQTSREEGFRSSFLALFTFISPKVAKFGLKGFYEELIMEDESFKEHFDDAFNHTYHTWKRVMTVVYDDATSKRDIRESITGVSNYNPEKVLKDDLKLIRGLEEEFRGEEIYELNDLSSFTAGVFIAGIMARAEILLPKGCSLDYIMEESLVTDADIRFIKPSGSIIWAPCLSDNLLSVFSLQDVADIDWIDDPIRRKLDACKMASV